MNSRGENKASSYSKTFILLTATLFHQCWFEQGDNHFVEESPLLTRSKNNEVG